MPLEDIIENNYKENKMSIEYTKGREELTGSSKNQAAFAVLARQSLLLGLQMQVQSLFFVMMKINL